MSETECSPNSFGSRSSNPLSLPAPPPPFTAFPAANSSKRFASTAPSALVFTFSRAAVNTTLPAATDQMATDALGTKSVFDTCSLKRACRHISAFKSASVKSNNVTTNLTDTQPSCCCFCSWRDTAALSFLASSSSSDSSSGSSGSELGSVPGLFLNDKEERGVSGLRAFLAASSSSSSVAISSWLLPPPMARRTSLAAPL
mmetsp:Transcript_61829/g.123936  ORF Transcript_61829/g.123936 Transcript_61829/m.123936 type:complete len:201 (-) Transcript_61829:469-1071(-)